MPIADQTLQPWEGRRFSQPVRWLVIADHEMRRAWKHKGTRILCHICWGFSLVYAIFLYILANREQLSQFIPIDRSFWENNLTVGAETFYGWMCGWTLLGFPALVFVAVAVGNSSIAPDLKHRALPLYLSRALSPWDYLLGKSAAVALFTSAISVIPVAILFFLNAYFRDDLSLLWTQGWVLAAILGYGLVVVVSMTLLTLMFSSLHKNTRFATMTTMGYFYLSHVLYVVLKKTLTYYDRAEDTTRTLGRWGWLSLHAVWHRIAAQFFAQDVPDSIDIGFVTAVVSLAILCGLCLLILRRRIRGLEVVS